MEKGGTYSGGAERTAFLDQEIAETGGTGCPHFGVCGGCMYRGIPYGEQLRTKERQVRELLGEMCPDGCFEGILGSPQTDGYRNKMEFSFGDEVKGGPLTLGLHKRGSFYDVINADHCRIVHSDFTEILTATREYFAANGIGFYRKRQHTGYLRHLLIRRAVKTGEILAALVTSGQYGGEGLPLSPDSEKILLDGWKDRLLALPLDGRFAGILHVRNDSPADVVRSDGTGILYGQDCFYEELLGLKFKITPFSFFQTNSAGAEVLYETVREYVGDTRGKAVFDLYSGTGTIAQVLARAAEKVAGVEIVSEAVEAARQNAAANGLTNCEFIAGDVTKVLREWTAERENGKSSADTEREAGGLSADTEQKNGKSSADVEREAGGLSAGAGGTPDVVVLDPPRDGIHPKVLEQIGGEIRPERIVYISCQPASLARDLEKLLAYGYRVERVCCVDMFPQTRHIETVCALSRIK